MGLKVLVQNCPRLPTIVVILDESSPLRKGPKRPQMCIIVDDCAQLAESGLKPPFESPQLDFPDVCYLVERVEDLSMKFLAARPLLLEIGRKLAKKLTKFSPPI